jgi:hypothetical protein
MLSIEQTVVGNGKCNCAVLNNMRENIFASSVKPADISMEDYRKQTL